MKSRKKSADPNAPKPVHPTALRHHGLFSIPYVRQHMIVDDQWTISSLTEEFKGMADLLAIQAIFNKLQGRACRKHLTQENRQLKRQCRDGRTKLQLSLYGNNMAKIRNFLINHRDMQRLYQKMPVHLVMDNMDQRTFVMRKEKDRLLFRLAKLKKEYEASLLTRADRENRIKYEDEFVLEEEIKSREFMKRIENSGVRLQAFRMINSTYKKMAQVLRQESIFYEPILRSLSKDIEDQGNFIKHILYIGMPAIGRFKELSEEYRKLYDKSHKTTQENLQWASNFKKTIQQKSANVVKPAAKTTDDEDAFKRYVRETDSMLVLRNTLEGIEGTIKQVQFATLCSQAKEIYPRIKSQVENNMKLNKDIENNMLGHQSLGSKKKQAEVLADVLIHNLGEEEITRKERIEQLKDDIAREDEFEVMTIEHIKNRADAYVLLRFTLWNINDILRHVDRSSRVTRISYPSSYLQLPLLKFEMLTMRAWAPAIYEENIDAIMHTAKRKLHHIMKSYKMNSRRRSIDSNINTYHAMFLEELDIEETDVHSQQEEEEEDMMNDSKNMYNVPNRKQIKSQSSKIVEELSKKEE